MEPHWKWVRVRSGFYKNNGSKPGPNPDQDLDPVTVKLLKTPYIYVYLQTNPNPAPASPSRKHASQQRRHSLSVSHFTSKHSPGGIWLLLLLLLFFMLSFLHTCVALMGFRFCEVWRYITFFAVAGALKIPF